MDIYLTIRRKKLTIFLDATENTYVHELKKKLEALTRVDLDNLQLYKDGKVMEDDIMLGDYGIKNSVAIPQNPAEIGLAYRDEESLQFESLEITPYSDPPELPDVLKSSISGQEATAS